MAKVPASLKSISSYIKIAQEHDCRDQVISYYCRMYAIQKGMELKGKTKEDQVFLMGIMEDLEKMKSENSSNHIFKNESQAKEYIQSYALKIFRNAYQKDLLCDFSPVTIKCFYTSGMLLDVISLFGTTLEQVEKARLYAKWKAIYLVNCNKEGETPTPGPILQADPEAVGPDMDQLPDSNFTPLLKPVDKNAPSSSNLTPSANLPIPPNVSIDNSSSDKNNEDTLDPKVFSDAEKKTKYALSALSYLDRTTALRYLQEAIELLSIKQNYSD